MNTRKRHVLRRVLIVLGIVLFLVILALGVIYWFILPPIAHREIQVALRRQWHGASSVGPMRINVLHPSVIEHIELRDEVGNFQVRAQNIALGLADWFGGHPRLTSVHVGYLFVNIGDIDRLKELPLAPPEPREKPKGPSKLSRFVDMEQLSVDNLVAVVGAGRGATAAQYENVPESGERPTAAASQSVGEIRGNLLVQWDDEGHANYGGHLSATNVDLATLLKNSTLTKGLIWLEANYAGRDFDEINFTARGRADGELRLAQGEATATSASQMTPAPPAGAANKLSPPANQVDQPFTAEPAMAPAAPAPAARGRTCPSSRRSRAS